ncbi:MAG: hypothetical protein H3C35_10910 [Bacteroidetes bacterium]|nr:hypothetical protein [Bacteroidota bacterium]
MKKIFVVVFLLFSSLYSQDFGYEYAPVNDFRSFGASYSLQQFTPSAGSGIPDSLRIKFSTPLPFFEYRQMDLRAAIGYQTYLLNNKSRSSFSVYLQQASDFLLNGDTQKSGIYLPIILSTNYIMAEGDAGRIRNFEIGSIGAGTGLKYKLIASSFALQLYAAGTYHYSTAGFSTEYGTLLMLQSEILFAFPDVIAGYRFEKQEWNLSGQQLDYQRIIHGVFIGLMF